MSKRKIPTAEIKRHWHNLSWNVGCIITGESPATIHHVHGGSMALIRIHAGLGMKVSDWLVIPLAARFHTGEHGIDNGMGFYKSVNAWEKRFGFQLDHLKKIALITGVDIFKNAGVECNFEGQ